MMALPHTFSLPTRRIAEAMLALLVTANSACGASVSEGAATCPVRAPASLRIVATEHMNPNARGEGLPTELRLYQVRSEHALDALSFENVWRNGGTALGESLVSEETLTLYPGETITRPLHLEDGATHLAAVVIVREPEGRAWTVSAPLQGTGTEACPASPAITLRVDGPRIESFASEEGQ